MLNIALNVLPEHGLSVHVLRGEPTEELVADAIRGEENEFDSTLDFEERFVFDNEVHLVDGLHVSGAVRASVVRELVTIEVLEGVSTHTAVAVELSELKEIQGRDAQDIETDSEQLLLRCATCACLYPSQLVMAIQYLSKLCLG